MATPTTSSSSPQIPGLNSYPPPSFSPYVAPATTSNIALPVAALGASSFLILLSCLAATWCRHRQIWRDQRSSANAVLPTVNSTDARGAPIDGGVVPWEHIKVDGYYRGGSNESGKRLGVMPVLMPGEVNAHVLALEDKAELSRNSRSVSVLTDDAPVERRPSMTSVMSDEDSLQKTVSIFDEVPL